MPSLHGRGGRGAGGALWALQVRHVAVGQVSHKAAVRETPPEEIHGCSWMEMACSTQMCPGEAQNTGCQLGDWWALGQSSPGNCAPPQVSFSRIRLPVGNKPTSTLVDLFPFKSKQIKHFPGPLLVEM
jgi:hypothetical protein